MRGTNIETAKKICTLMNLQIVLQVHLMESNLSPK